MACSCSTLVMKQGHQIAIPFSTYLCKALLLSSLSMTLSGFRAVKKLRITGLMHLQNRTRLAKPP